MTLRDAFRFLSLFWREGLLALLRLLPWLVLLGLGMFWLYETGWLLVWAAFGAALALAAWPLRKAIRRRAKSRAADLLGLQALPEGEVTARERQAQAVVHRLCVAAGAEDIASQAAATALVRRTVMAVAEVFHPGQKRAWARFTLVELLDLVEQVARGVREGAARNVIGSDVVRLDTVLWGADLAKRHGGSALVVAKILHLGWRVRRVVMSPLRSAVNELQGAAESGSDGALGTMARAALAQLLVRETGRVAIRLYSGRLAEDPALAAARAVPIRLLLCGQAGAGKTALAKAVSATLGGDAPRISTAIKILEGPALDGTATSLKRLLNLVPRADVVVWVAAATQPARAPDFDALAALRKVPAAVPPVLLALTRCDQLSPVREWAPPYDFLNPAPGGKGATIRAALEAVAEQFAISLERAIPIALPPGRAPYNLESLFGAVAETLPYARQRQIELAVAARGFPLRRVLSQAVSGGRFLLRSVKGTPPRTG